MSGTPDSTFRNEPALSVAEAARELYRSAPLRARALQQLWPFICPFDELIRRIPASGRIMDVGCGAGLFLGLIGKARPSVSAIGFDADARAIAAAQSMAEKHFPDGRIVFQRSDVGEPWPQRRADVVSMIDVLHHIPPNSQQSVIRTAYDHVAPGGYFVYKDMAHEPFFRAWWNRFHDLVIARQWISYRPIEEVEAWLTAMGAEILERSAKVMGPYGHELIVAKRPA